MANQTLESQAKKYANELNTFAYEYGFSSQEGWCLVPTSEAKKNEVEKNFYPTLSASIDQEKISEFQSLVLSKLRHIDNGADEKASVSPAIKNVLYLTAYNPNRKA